MNAAEDGGRYCDEPGTGRPSGPRPGGRSPIEEEVLEGFRPFPAVAEGHQSPGRQEVPPV